MNIDKPLVQLLAIEILKYQALVQLLAIEILKYQALVKLLAIEVLKCQANAIRALIPFIWQTFAW